MLTFPQLNYFGWQYSLKKLEDEPEKGKPLTSILTGLWSLRIGDYRAIYQIKNNELIILVIKIGHRKNVY